MKINNLVENQISGICFGIDYFEVHFNGPILRFFGTVKIVNSALGAEAFYPGPEGRDRLCDLVGRDVSKVFFEDELTFALSVHGGIRLVASLIETRECPELLHFVPGRNQPIEVW